MHKYADIIISCVLHTIFLGFVIGMTLFGFSNDKNFPATSVAIASIGAVVVWMFICIRVLIISKKHQQANLQQIPQVQQVSTAIDVECPICRKINIIPTNQTKLFGIEIKCSVCMERPCEVFLPECGHVCLCHTCAVTINHKSQV
jgi:hypothetical protein